MSKSLPARPNLEFLKKEAKDLLEAFQRGDPATLPVVRHLRYLNGIPDAELLMPGRAELTLQRAQYCLAVEYGCADWEALTARVVGAMPRWGKPDAVDRASVAPVAREMFVAQAGAAPISRRGTDELIKALVTLTAVGRRHGLVAFTTLADEHFDEEPARVGLAALAAGRSPGEARDAMAARKVPALDAYDCRQALVIAGVVRIGAGYTPEAMRGALAAMPASEAIGEPAAGMPDADRPSGREALDRELSRMPAWRRRTADVIPLFVALVEVAHREGLVALDGIGDWINDDLIRTGLQPVVDGTDVELVRSILEARRTTLRTARERRWDMIAMAVHEASQGTNPNLVNAWCRAML